MIYIIPLILILIGIINCDINRHNKSSLIVILFTFLTLLIGLRYKVGGDTYNYINFYEYSPDVYDWNPYNIALFEPGFSYLTAIIKTFTNNIYLYQTIIAIIFNILLFRYINNNTRYFFSTIFIIYIAIYLYFTTEIIRESIAVGIIINAYSLAQKRHYSLYFAMVMLSMLFHSGAIIAIIFPVVSKIRFNRNFLLICTITVLLLIVSQPIMHFLSSYSILNKINRYISYQNVGYLWAGFRFIYFGLIPLLFLCFFKKRERIQYEGLICFQFLLSLGLFFVPIIFQRLINYTIIFYLSSLVNLTMPAISQRIKYQKKSLRSQVSFFIVILTLIAHSSFYIHLNFYQIWIPYHSIFDPIEESMRLQFVAGD